MLLICVILMPIVVYAQMIDLNVGYNKLTLQLIPSLNKGKAHVYHILAFCNTGKTLYAKRDHSKSVQTTPLIKNAPNFDDVITFMFDNEQCANYTIYVWLELENDQNWITWPAAYKKEMIEKNIINHRIVFSNYFHLTISPTLEGHDIFYSIRVFCEESENAPKKVPIGEGSKKSAETVSNDDYTKYKFKTYTKRKTMVVFNSEQPQCNNNTYHIKVWAMPKHWLYLYPTDRPIVHYVCKSKGAGEKRNIYFMNHFQLTIEPKLPEDDEHIYYVEVRCYNNIKMQTFKTITRGSTYVVLHKFSCDAYDIAAQKVPKKWTLQIELFKRAIEETKGALELNVTINNGYTFIFDYDKCLNNWPARSKRITVPTFKNGSTSKQKTDKEKFRTFIELSDDDDENDNESKATKGEKE
ncbi:hypothetical protein GPALN_010420 [Globodera pallida]|nr:hypothetical protein GPALN_010420 [Globodera pallida]